MLDEQIEALAVQQLKDKKVNMDVQYLMDATTLSSFYLVIVIALILCSLMTWLAYKYGQKNLKLIQIASKIVSSDIQGAEQAQIQFTKETVPIQGKLKEIEMEFPEHTIWQKNFREECIKYLSTVTQFKYLFVQYREKLKVESIILKTHEIGSVYESLKDLSEEMIPKLLSIEFYLNNDDVSENNKIIDLGSDLNISAHDILIKIANNDIENIEYEKFNKTLLDLKWNLKQMLGYKAT